MNNVLRHFVNFYMFRAYQGPSSGGKTLCIQLVQASWNVMAHAQKPDFIFRRNGRVLLNRRRASVQSTTGSRVVRISGSNAGYTMFWGRVKGTGYPRHSPVSPSLPLPCVTMCHHISTGLYLLFFLDDCLLSLLHRNCSTLFIHPIFVYIRLYVLMMGLDMPETCRGWRNILRIICASIWFFFTRLYVGHFKSFAHRTFSL